MISNKSSYLPRSNLKLFLFFAILAIFLTPTQQFLNVYIPECATKINPDPIPYTLANFGYIPYGQSIIGKVLTPTASNNQQLCTQQGETPIQKSKSADISENKQNNIKNILLVKRGTCRFTQKVLIAQKLGADFVIIYDNETTQKPHIIMKNDGQGHLVNIPSIFISNTNGLNLIKSLNECNENLFMKHSFEVFQSDIVDLDLWLNLNKRESYILLRDLVKYNYYSAIKSYVNMNVRFKVDKGCRNDWCSDEDCIGTGQNKYCIPIQLSQDKKPQTDQASGSSLLTESLRMIVLFQNLLKQKNTLWFDYMNKFDLDLCLQEQDVQDCSYTAMKKAGISQQMIALIKSNQTKTLALLNQADANLHQNNTFYNIWKESDEKHVIFYPQAIINGKNFYGLFKAPDVFQMICQSLISQPKQCYSFIKNRNSSQNLDQTENMFTTILFIIALMTMGFLVALFIYTRLIKRQVNQQMSMEINKMVQNYVSLTDQKSASSESNQKGSFEQVHV